MSFQAQPQQQQQPQPQQQQQQPVQVYPNTITNQEPPHHSDGSFVTVFIVLAVIVFISAIACCLGRFCNRRYHGHSHSHSHKQKPSKQKKQNPKSLPKGDYHPKAGFHTKDPGDIELGFDKRIPTAKPNGHEYGHGHTYGQGHGHGGARGPKPPANGDTRGSEVRFADEGEPSAGA